MNCEGEQLKITRSLGLSASISGRMKILREIRGVKTFDRFQRTQESPSIGLELDAKARKVAGLRRNPVGLRIISLGVENMGVAIAN